MGDKDGSGGGVASGGAGGATVLSRRKLEARHAEELRELKARIRAMAKESKKAKKEAAAKGPVWTREMKERHTRELEGAGPDTASEAESGEDDGEEDDGLSGLLAMSEEADKAAAAAAEEAKRREAEDKRAREQKKAEAAAKKKARKEARRAAKAKAEAEREAEIEAEKAAAPDERAIENAAIQSRLDGLGLTMRKMPADGNCLFHSVADQLQRAGHSIATRAGKTAYKELRMMTADYLERNGESFGGFLVYTEEDEASGEPLASYCARLRDTAEWGGEPELRALAEAVGCPITVHSAGSDPLEVNAGADGPNVHVSFHQRYYALGDHYNSVIPQADA